jgi:hypothetical protein
MTHPLPSSCERAILEQFLKAEAMALWAVRSAQVQEVPPAVLEFLRRHEEEEAQHLKQFELLLGLVCPVNGGSSRCISTGTKPWDWSSQRC